MNEIITEKKYPVSWLWVLQSISRYFSGLIVLVLLLVFSPFIQNMVFNLIGDLEEIYPYLIIAALISVGYLMKPILRRKRFHYSFKDNDVKVEQGIISKQEKEILYSTIVNVEIKQDLLDKIYHLYSLIIEFNDGEKSEETVLEIAYKMSNKIQRIGVYNNLLIIPGLSEQNAETLKYEITKRIRGNI